MNEKISAIIITCNEERTLKKCIMSVQAFCDEIIVVDSGSSDSTYAIARNFTDKIFVHPWSGYTPQKQFAISKAVNDWIFWIDADEEVSPALSEELASCTFSHQGYAFPRLVWYCGRWIRHCGWYPDYVVRLFNRHHGTLSDTLVHESIIIDGSIAKFKAPIFHYSYKSLSHHCEKMNSFTSLHAQQHQLKKSGTHAVALITKPLFHFVKSFFIRKGFRDGIPGLIVCIMGSFYTFLKYAKRWEINNINNEIPRIDEK
jgi:glycosyltransferase involved in cell wall biosynthesis